MQTWWWFFIHTGYVPSQIKQAAIIASKRRLEGRCIHRNVFQMICRLLWLVKTPEVSNQSVEGMVSQLGACTSCNIRPFDFIVYETIKSELMKFHGKLRKPCNRGDILQSNYFYMHQLPNSTQFHCL